MAVSMVVHVRAGNECVEALLDLNSLIMNGRLCISWRYSPECVAEDTVSTLAETLRGKLEALIAHCLTIGPAPTASDFALSGLTQPQLEALALSGDVADIYPATDLQQGLLFHGMLSKTAGHYINQMRMTLGVTDRESLRQAWQAMLDRHEVLRTAFIPSPSGVMLQVVRRTVRCLMPDMTGLVTRAMENLGTALSE